MILAGPFVAYSQPSTCTWLCVFGGVMYGFWLLHYIAYCCFATDSHDSLCTWVFPCCNPRATTEPVTNATMVAADTYTIPMQSPAV